MSNPDDRAEELRDWYAEDNPDGAGLLDVLPQVSLLAALAAGFLGLAATLFRWE